MFETDPAPRVFGLAPGVDFARALVDGLRMRMDGQAPEAMARVELIVNTHRMQRRITSAFCESGASFLPRIRLVTHLADPLDLARMPKPVPALRRKLELARLVGKLVETQPGIAPRAAIYDLADSLNALLDEMQAEGVTPDDLAKLDLSDQSGHWQRALQFVNIVTRYTDPDHDAPDAAGLNRRVLRDRLASWEETPPSHPVIVAGSTGSRGTAFALMQAVARLPQGAVVLPGFDFETPLDIWSGLRNQASDMQAMQGEDHPQFRFARLMEALDLDPVAIRHWAAHAAPCPERNRLVSLALRPAPVTDQWLKDGPGLPMLDAATRDVTLLEAPAPRQEALAIALRLRKAAEDGTTAALITPDRMLTRRVSAILDRWDILPDDSAGTPPQLTAPGRFLRHVAALRCGQVTAEALLTLLKHPLCHRGEGRSQHLLWTSELELFIRREGLPFPTRKTLAGWSGAEEAEEWLDWIEASFLSAAPEGKRPLAMHIEAHLAQAEAICAGAFSADSSELWARPAGKICRKACEMLSENAACGGEISAHDYADLFHAVLRDDEVRDRDAPHPNILVWGTIEARIMGPDLLILGGLNEGTWPDMPPADPWLNRRMRQKAGLLLPERRIGLAAHDFQQACGAPEVWLSRSLRSDDAETVPSRWLNRLTNLMRGLPERAGPDALDAMRDRGRRWLERAEALETPIPSEAAPRPAPVPPVAARPTSLSVTRIEKLIRDPYTIYASKILRLTPLNPVQKAPDAIIRGIVIHKVFEKFVSDTAQDAETVTRDRLIATTRDILRELVPWPTERQQWFARVARIADWFVERERARRDVARPVRFERTGKADLLTPPFTVTAKADRIDMDDRGFAHVFDYKTGQAPSPEQQLKFSLQLLLTAAIVEQGGFAGLSPRGVDSARFISLATTPREIEAPLADSPPDKTWARLARLLEAYRNPAQGYPARNALFKDDDASDYDQLSRFGEWGVSQEATTLWLK